MPSTAALQINLTEERLSFVTRKVQEGEFASESEVLDFAVAALQEEEAARKRWERAVLIPAHDELMADPASGIPIDEVERNLEARRQRRLMAS